MRVVLLTHVFPRAADDPLGAFLLHLSQGMRERAQVLVVAPHAAGLKDHENFGAIRVSRFHYAPDSAETLAYTGVMHEQVGRGIGGKFAFARFVEGYLRAARFAVRDWKPAVIHAHWWLPGGLVGAVVSKFSGVPLVITTHGTDVEQLRRAGWAKPLARFAFGQARVVTCGSNYLRDLLLELGIVDAARVCVIPMPVNPLFEKQRLGIRDWRLGATEDGGRGTDEGGEWRGESEAKGRKEEFRILTVARLTKQKNIETCLEAVARLREREIDARLQIVGDGDQRSVLQEKAKALQIEPFVKFLGMRPQTELPSLYQKADVFVLPSLREGMGLVLAEALLCHLPVIATRSGGVTDIVQDGETGLLFPERDARALADALEKYASDPAYAARLAANGCDAVLKRFTPEQVATQFLQVYSGALKVKN